MVSPAMPIRRGSSPDLDDDEPPNVLCRIHSRDIDSLKKQIEDLKVEGKQVLEGLGILTRDNADLRRIVKELSDNVIALNSRLTEFTRAWQHQCGVRHREVDRRLDAAENHDVITTVQSREQLMERIREAEEEKKELKRKFDELERKKNSDVRALANVRLERWKIIGTIIASAVGGGTIIKLLELLR